MKICSNPEFVEVKCVQYSDKEKECIYEGKHYCYYGINDRCRKGYLIFGWIDYLIYGYKWERIEFDLDED